MDLLESDGCAMTQDEARELVNGPLWSKVRERVQAGSTFDVPPRGDLRRLEFLAEDVREQIARWQEALAKVDEWKKVVDGAQVRRLKADYPGIYPEIFRYQVYFARWADEIRAGNFPPAATELLLRLRFPEALSVLNA